MNNNTYIVTNKENGKTLRIDAPNSTKARREAAWLLPWPLYMTTAKKAPPQPKRITVTVLTIATPDIDAPTGYTVEHTLYPNCTKQQVIETVVGDLNRDFGTDWKTLADINDCWSDCAHYYVEETKMTL